MTDNQVTRKPLIGFRSWDLVNTKEGCLLGSVTNDFCWSPGINTADCFYSMEEGAGEFPHSNHHCGFNAFFDPNERSHYIRNHDIFGAIAAAGHIELHSTGYRSEQAQILGLYSDPSEYSDIKEFSAIEEVANRYEVPLFFDKQELIEFSKSQGLYMPDEPVSGDASNWESLYWKNDSIDDQPSVDLPGLKIWYKNGSIHREGDRPAMVSGSTYSWYQEGKVHRDGDLPAEIFYDRWGNLKGASWYKNGIPHREGGRPAIVDKTTEGNHYTAWLENGKFHRDGGQPAVIYGDGAKEFWIDGKRVKVEKP